MLRVNLATGDTRTFDLEEESSLRDWETAQASSSFQASITGISCVITQGDQEMVFVVPRPKDLITWSCQLLRKDGRVIAESVTCIVDKFAISTVVYRRCPPTAKIEIERVGRRFR